MSDDPVDTELRQLFERLGFTTSSGKMLPLLRRARKAAEVSDVTVLLEGETGTGKRVLAQAIHLLDGKRNRAAFVTVHCSTISEALAESELFGHQRGAFSGAVGERKGLFQSAANGTLFLDDVNDLPLALQPKLLDVLQRGAVRPVGSDREVSLDVRIIAACNKPLEPLVQQALFRPDLYHRLNVVKLVLPPLRERREDLASLLLTFAKRHDNLYDPIVGVDSELLDYLESQPLMGNVRELENTVQRMLFLKSQGDSLGVEDWLNQAGTESPGSDPDLFAEAASTIWKIIAMRRVPYELAFKEIEKRVLEAAINVPGATKRQIARRLQTSERTLYYKMRVRGVGESAA